LAGDVGRFLQHVAQTEKDPLARLEEAHTALTFLYHDVLGLDVGELPFPDPPRLLDRLRRACRVRQFSPRTENCYARWAERFIRCHGLRHPGTLGGSEIELFLTDLAANGQVAASAQNQAFHALLFLYQQFLHLRVRSLGRRNVNPLGTRARLAVAACIALLAAGMGVSQGKVVLPPQPAAGDPRPVILLKPGESRTVQWCWGQANGRAEKWFVTADGVLPKGWKDGRPSQLTIEQHGVRFKLKVKASHLLSNDLFKTGPYTAAQKANTNTLVTAAVVRVSANPNAPPGGRRAVVHNISGTGYNLRLVAELRVVVTAKD
jgi:hypothetical protein